MGVIGTPEGKEQFEKWASRFSGAIDVDPGISSSIMFPRFETVFRMSWDATARVALTINPKELDRTIRNTDPH
jgi:hypothetical protein